MVQLDFQQREVTIKIVYYGPALSGKTTNLLRLHERAVAKSKGKLLSLDTHGDRTLFFDLLPLHVRSTSGVSFKLKVYTVPGQVMHDATRRMVLAGADGVAFIADSRMSETQNNNDSFANLMVNLRDNGMDARDVPVVIQFNKRDLPDARSDQEIDRIALKGSEQVFKATAVSGDGVLPTFFGLTDAVWQQLDRKFDFGTKFGVGRDEFLAKLRGQFGVDGG